MAAFPSPPATGSEGHDEGSEGAMLDFPNSLFVGPFLDVFAFSVAGGKRLSVQWSMGVKNSKRPPKIC